MSAAGTTLSPADRPKAAIGWQIAFWVGQVALAGMFAMAGGFKLAMSYADFVKMTEQMHGVLLPEPLLRFIGVAEVAGALGMILPAATRVAPILTAWAAVGLGTIMVLASALHASRGEWSELPVTLGLLAVAAFVAWGRFKKAPIAPRAGK